MSKLCMDQARAELHQAWDVSWCSTNAKWTDWKPVTISSAAASTHSSFIHSLTQPLAHLSISNLYMSLHPSTHPFIYVVHTFISSHHHSSIYPSMHPSIIHPPTHLCCPSVHIFLSPSIHPYIHPPSTLPPIYAVHPFISFHHHPSILSHRPLVHPSTHEHTCLSTCLISLLSIHLSDTTDLIPLL